MRLNPILGARYGFARSKYAVARSKYGSNGSEIRCVLSYPQADVSAVFGREHRIEIRRSCRKSVTLRANHFGRERGIEIR